MTNQPTPPQNGQQAAQDALVKALQEQAMADEQQAATEAAMAHLQQRVVALNVEVRVRDRRIQELEAEVAALKSADEAAKVPSSGDQDA